MMAEPSGDILTIDELATYLKIPKSTLYKLVREGAVPCQKVGKHWRFHKDAIEAWIKDGIPATQANRTTRKTSK